MLLQTYKQHNLQDDRGPSLVSDRMETTESGRSWSFHLPSVQGLQQWTFGTERQNIAGGNGVLGSKDQLIDQCPITAANSIPCPQSLVINYIKKQKKKQNQNLEKRQAIKVKMYNHPTSRKINNRSKRGQFNNYEK